jgi:putative transposase
MGGEDLSMPWVESNADEQRLRFIVAALAGDETMTALCARYAISRKTGYKWLARYEAEGNAGLNERSRAPHAHGRARPAEVVEAALALKERWRHWGPRKLRVKLVEQHPDWVAPAASTIGDWLEREGLTRPRRWRRRCPPYTQPFAAASAPNAVWSADFKGWFRTGDGRRCDPLTVSDGYSRYLLACQAVARPDHAHTQPVFDALFCEYGLPLAIRSDNGPPFATIGAGGLSRLAVWWLKLGIHAERIAPGQPQQNGRHERMHGTLKAATADPPAATCAAQQLRFRRFRREFNHERPHEALGQKPPATLYVASSRSYPCALREPDYGPDQVVRRVRSNGEIKWRGQRIYISEALIGEPVALAETAHGAWRVCFGDVELGFIGHRGDRLERRPPPCAR